MTTISMSQHAGAVAESLEAARKIRTEMVLPALDKGDKVFLNFAGVTKATQPFIHTLIAELFDKFGDEVLDVLSFKACNDSIKGVIMAVFDEIDEAREQ